MKKKGQNLIEFALVMPLLFVIIFGVIELAFFWRAVHNVQSLALQAASNAATQFVFDDQESTDVYDINCQDGSCFNLAVAKAVNVIEKRQGSLVPQGSDYSCVSRIEYGSRPFTVYDCISDKTVEFEGSTVPAMTMHIDYRDPKKDGLIVQIEHYYKTLFLGASFMSPSGTPVYLLPETIKITSSKVHHYITQ